jgi:hypothetical protein
MDGSRTHERGHSDVSHREQTDRALDIMHFKRFDGTQIAEIWELYDSAQLEA